MSDFEDNLPPYVAPEDTPPTAWAPDHVELTDEEAEAGNLLGDAIDIDDDADDGQPAVSGE